MSKSLAMVTMVYNEPDFLPIWLRYYGSQVGAANCYVLDHGSDDGSTDFVGGASRIRIPRSEFNEWRRSQSISALCASLLQWYDFVAYTDVDEILVVDPLVAPSLPEFCASADRLPVTTAIGMNLFHRMGHELPLDYERPILQQRSVAYPMGNMCKPSLIRQPVNWVHGFHSYDGPAHFDGLYLFHLAFMDYALALRRQEKRQRVAAQLDYKHHPHKNPPSVIRQWIEGWSRIPVQSGTAGEEMRTDFQRRIIASQAGREKERYRIDMNINGAAVWRIPDRFRDRF